MSVLQGRGRCEVVVIRQNRVRLGAEKIVVPDSQQRQDHRHVLRQRRMAKMFVHLVRAFQQLGEAFRAHRQHDRQSDRRP